MISGGSQSYDFVLAATPCRKTTGTPSSGPSTSTFSSTPSFSNRMCGESWRSPALPGQLAESTSALKSPTGPRWASLSGLTIELMLGDLTVGDLERQTPISRCWRRGRARRDRR